MRVDSWRQNQIADIDSRCDEFVHPGEIDPVTPWTLETRHTSPCTDKYPHPDLYLDNRATAPPPSWCLLRKKMKPPWRKS
jgi:hypothetical protein